ncbi:MAG: hypothetical protein ACYTE8_08420 [Planctomycetota bacterium]|jgi:hypothetical protein
MRKFNLLRVSVVGILILCLCLTLSFGQQEKKPRVSMDQLIRQSFEKQKGTPASEPQNQDTQAKQEQLEEGLNAQEQLQPEKDPNKPVDPFTVIDREGKNEMREWIYGKQDDRLALSKRVQDQVTAELNYIRKAAQTEGAAQTLEAIDKIIANRNERFDRINKRVREEKIKAQQSQPADTRQGIRGRGATGTGRGTTGTGRGATRGNQNENVGPRGRMYQGQGTRSSGTRQNGY